MQVIPTRSEHDPNRGTPAVAVLCLGALLLAAAPALAHHAIRAKFDDTKPTTLTGVVTLVDWRNPHVHVFINVPDGSGVANWAIELESPIELQRSGWNRESVQPGDRLTVEGISARNGSRQVWGNTLRLADSGKQVLDVKPYQPREMLATRPTPRWPDNQPRLGGLPGGVQGHWAHPSATALVETGVTVEMDRYGQLRNIADAARVAPMQPWAVGLYRHRQSRFLQDDPTFLHCKPTGGPRQYQMPEGVQFVEDRERRRVFVLVGSGNSNFRVMYLDGRDHVGQVGGDDDNPLYYGRSVGRWEGDTLVVDTRGFNEDFWFTNGGLPHTDQLRLTERFTRVDFDTLRYDLTVDDPGAYTRPWNASWTLRWVGGEDVPKHMCQDNRP
jgi:hypothetical protein